MLIKAMVEIPNVAIRARLAGCGFRLMINRHLHLHPHLHLRPRLHLHLHPHLLRH